MGFGVPLDHWFRQELKELGHEMLFGSQAVGRGIFRAEGVRRLWDEHQSRHFDHSARLWALVMLECWQRTWLDSASAPIQPALVTA
jgi:asparagine synthase (glutamine-hydrolysing)